MADKTEPLADFYGDATQTRVVALQEAVKAVTPAPWNMRDTGTYRRELLTTAKAFETFLKTGATQ